MPAYHLLDMDFYSTSRQRIPYSFLNFAPADHRVGSLLTSRGCPYSCIFCHNSWKGLKFRSLSPQRVLEEVQLLIRDFGIQSIFFIDDDFFFNRKRLMEICDLFIENNVNLVWGCNSRVTDVTRESLKKAQEAGCRQVTFGFESASQRVLEVLNKKATVEQAHKAIELCNEIGMEISGTFIVGTPTETIEDIEMTKEFIETHDIDSIGITKMTPFPGTAVWDWCEKHGYIPENICWSDFNYSDIPIRTNNAMSMEEIDYACSNLRDLVAKKYYEKHPNTGGKLPPITFKYMLKYPRKTIKRIFNSSS